MSWASERLLLGLIADWHAAKQCEGGVPGAAAVDYLEDFYRRAKAAVRADAARSDLHRLTPRELATLLSALRFWQRHREEAVRLAPEFFGRNRPLTEREIDDLCSRLNQ